METFTSVSLIITQAPLYCLRVACSDTRIPVTTSYHVFPAMSSRLTLVPARSEDGEARSVSAELMSLSGSVRPVSPRAVERSASRDCLPRTGNVRIFSSPRPSVAVSETS